MSTDRAAQPDKGGRLVEGRSLVEPGYETGERESRRWRVLIVMGEGLVPEALQYPEIVAVG